MNALDDTALDRLFRTARSMNGWKDKPLAPGTLEALYDLLKYGPTSANCSPARFVFLASQEAKERIRPHLSSGNVKKVMTAPATVIIGTHKHYYDRIPELFPHNPGARGWFTDTDDHGAEAGFRNGTLQGAYLILAARALGLDCGPMSGFSTRGVNAEFFPEGDVSANFICAIGHGDPASVHPRLPRLSFADACQVL